MLEELRRIGIEHQVNPNDLVDGVEGSRLEILDHTLLSKYGLDFTTLPIPRIMGLYRQLRIESEEIQASMKKGKGGM